jgi:Winged helix-turn helix
VFDICRRYAERGAAGLKSGPRGPEPGHGRFLDAGQEAEARDLIRRHTPDELDLPFALWSRAAVRELIRQRFGVRLAVRTMGTYLARWGFMGKLRSRGCGQGVRARAGHKKGRPPERSPWMAGGDPPGGRTDARNAKSRYQEEPPSCNLPLRLVPNTAEVMRTLLPIPHAWRRARSSGAA